METQTALGVLTRDDIKALRTCDRASIYWRKDLSAIYCIKEARKAGPFDGDDRKHVIPIDNRIKDYSEGAGSRRGVKDAYCCFVMLSRYDGQPTEIGSLAAILRPGDVLGVLWVRSNNNDVQDAAGFSRDDCYATVTRGKTVMHFLLDVRVGPDNSARLCRLA